MSTDYIGECRRSRQVSDFGDYALEDDFLQTTCPALYEFLCRTIQQGKPRLTSALTLFQEHGKLKYVLRDKDAVECLWGALDGSEDFLVQVDTQIRNGEGSWRPDKPNPFAGRSRNGS